MGHHHDDVEDARQRAKTSRKQIETGGQWKPPEGKSTIRLLETPGDKERNSQPLYLEYQVHRNIGPNKRFGRCGNEPGSSKNRCWLCSKRAKLEKEGRTRQAAVLAPQNMLAVQIAYYDREMEEWIGPLLWEMSSGKSADAIGYKILGKISDDRRNYTSHTEGYDLDFKRTGTGLKTKWGDIDHADKPSKVPKGIIKKLKPFVDTGMRQYDEQWLKDAYYGRDNKKENEEMANKKKKDESDEEVDDSSNEVSNDDSSDDSSDNSSDKDTKKKKKRKGKKDDSDDDSSDDSSKDDSDKDDSDDDSDKDDSDDDSSDDSSKDDSDKDDSDDDSDKDDSDDDSDKDDSDKESDKDSSDDDSDEDNKKKKKKRKPRAKAKPKAKAKRKKKK